MFDRLILSTFADSIRRQGLSLHQVEIHMGVSDTYISRAISQKIVPSQAFLLKATKFIMDAEYK